MKRKKVRVAAVPTATLWDRLKTAGIDLPANVSRIIVDAKAGGVVEVHWACFADEDVMEVISEVIVDVQKRKRVRTGPSTPEVE